MEQDNYEIADRLNWQQACTFLGCGKSELYRRTNKGDLIAYGVGTRNRWYSRKECQQILDDQKESQDAQR